MKSSSNIKNKNIVVHMKDMAYKLSNKINNHNLLLK